jgi:hypothetical protein
MAHGSDDMVHRMSFLLPLPDALQTGTALAVIAQARTAVSAYG